MRFIGKFGGFLKKSKGKVSLDAGKYLDLVQREPGNAKAHLKLAEIYQKKGERQKAISEYLTAADIFVKNNFYARAMAIYKQVPKQDPSLDHVYLKIADIYRKMGFIGDALAQYRILVRHYDGLGLKNRALEVMALMAEVDPLAWQGEKGKGLKGFIQTTDKEQKAAGLLAENQEEFGVRPQKVVFFDLGAELETDAPMELQGVREVSNLEKVSSADEIFKELKETSAPSTVDPHFNYNMGVACKEMGFLDDAVEQLQIAIEKGQSPFEAAILLGLCLKEMDRWDEARQAFEKALKIEGISQNKKLNVKYELGLLLKGEGKTEEALGILREIAAVDQGFRDTKNEIERIKEAPQGRGTSPKK